VRCRPARAGAIESVVGPLVGLDRSRVSLLRLRISLDLGVQLADVVSKGDEVLPRRDLYLRDLAVAPLSATVGAESEQCSDSASDGEEPVGKAVRLLLLRRGLGLGTSCLADPAHEVRKNGCDAFVAVRLKGFCRQVARRDVAVHRSELVADDDSVHGRRVGRDDPAVQFDHDAGRRPVGLAPRCRREDGDVERPTRLLLDLSLQTANLRRRQEVGARMDVDRPAAE
jgi:hypothetical protein